VSGATSHEVTGPSASGPSASGAETPAPASALCGPLEVRHVTVRAGDEVLLAGVTVRLHPGELCGLIGPSGAGKSTLLKVLLGLRKPESGDVRIGGRAFAETGPAGYVPQQDALHRALTVERALHYATLLRMPAAEDEQRRDRVERVLRQVGLAEKRRVRIARLSGGQAKRVSVALELVTSPGLLILDEPTSGLDPGLEAQLMRLFADLARAGHIVLVATHAMESLEQCQALLLLCQGHVAYFGAPREALRYFGVPRYAEIFPLLGRRRGAEWQEAFMADAGGRAFAARPAPAPGAAAS
jgi:ABC transport system ATP-binding/permease protein